MSIRKRVASTVISLSVALGLLCGMAAQANALVRFCGIISQSNTHTEAQILADAGNNVYITAIHGTTYNAQGPRITTNLKAKAMHPGGSSSHGWQGGCVTLAQCQ